MKAVNTNATVVHAIALPVALELIASSMAGAMQEVTSLSETMGTLTRDAGKLVAKNPDLLDPFMDACRQFCGAVGLTEGSFKVYMSNIRGVIRAMCSGYKPKDGQSLRAMYDAAPKGLGANKGNAGPRHSVKTGAGAVKAEDGADDAADDENGVAVASAPSKPVSKADARRAAMIVLFGHADDELEAALDWAAKNELSFVRYVKANLSVAKEPALKKAA